MNENFSKNLRHVCAEQVSIAQICRDIGINQQQFSRYLRGTAMPSAHNMRRICHYFDLTDSDLVSDPKEFVQLRSAMNRSGIKRSSDPFLDAFPGNISRLRHYVGAYNVHFRSPSWPDCIVIGAAFLDENDGQIDVCTIERGSGPDNVQLKRTRGDGRAGYHSDRIFIVEFEGRQDGSLAQTVLYPSRRLQQTYLKGMALGIAWRPRRTPYASRVMWKKADNHMSKREVLERCGVYRIDSKFIDPIVRKFLIAKQLLSVEDEFTEQGD